MGHYQFLGFGRFLHHVNVVALCHIGFYQILVQCHLGRIIDMVALRFAGIRVFTSLRRDASDAVALVRLNQVTVLFLFSHIDVDTSAWCLI